MSFYSDLKKFNNRTALIFNDLNFSYTSLLEDADKIAKIIKKRSLIFILGDNDPETIISLVASDISNSVVMMLDNKINYLLIIGAINHLIYKPEIYLIIFSLNVLKFEIFEQ